MRTHFYNKTIRGYIVAFASIFDDLKCRTEDNLLTPVPLHYAGKDKFYAMLTENLDLDATNVEITLPRIAFELSSLNFAPERHLAPTAFINNRARDKTMRNRVPYDFSFSVYVATKDMEDGLEIVEQILPFFTPEVTITVNEVLGNDLEVNLPIILNSVSFNNDYEGLFEEKKRVEWTLQFTLKGYLYVNVVDAVQIKKAIVDIRNSKSDELFNRIMSSVVPSTANATDPHAITTVSIEPPL